MGVITMRVTMLRGAMATTWYSTYMSVHACDVISASHK